MTVSELIEELKQKPSNSKVCISVKGNTYDVGGVVTIQGYNWVIVDNDVAIERANAAHRESSCVTA